MTKVAERIALAAMVVVVLWTFVVVAAHSNSPYATKIVKYVEDAIGWEDITPPN
jgi:hypothetical protein